MLTENTAPKNADFDWRTFLLRWSGEWADALPDDEVRDADDEAARQSRWLGLPPASEERIAAMEKRLGRRMPPSYRSFLQVTDGWRHAGGFVWLLAGTADARWHDNESGLADVFEEYLEEDAEPEERREAGVWRRGLQLDVESDATYVLLDPEDVDEDGEWAVYTWAGWRADAPERHRSFRAFMEAMFREFHSLRAHRTDGVPEFVNATTRELDARVEEARGDALRGDWERALKKLDEAKGYGRPRAEGRGDQIRRLLGLTYMVYFRELVTDPTYASELLPLLVAEHASSSHDDNGLTFHLRGADETLLSRARATLEQVRAGTYRYTAPGPFGEAVGRARELAGRGDTDQAWRALTDALPLWEPLGPDHIAPLGWVADPLLGPLLTPERSREFLSTPRGGRPGETPSPAPGLDPPGLDWLADRETGIGRRGYRFVLVEGVPPEDLPGRLGDEDERDAGLGAPMTIGEARQQRLRGTGGVWSSVSSDRPVMMVGRAGAGWSFAFDGHPNPFDPERFVSPAASASSGTRAVAVWADLSGRHDELFFHLSVARDGVEEYAFTYAEGELRRTGEIPPALDPNGFFTSAEAATKAERPLLRAVAEHFVVRLPRHALLNGRLYSFTSRSWTRPPKEGEAVFIWGAMG
ncbi:SMI1/KNR4 family protein [Streptomyces cellulosae]